ncbi:RND family transporter [Amycolatopsis nigrescens]|uniref:MMPL/RND family transporter n=1 Tax=Amycolatopsis nigrescens TaxID=381445 RepID=UPI00037BD012|nr:RND family transporter [Amycolatopsis nigrescens]
MGHRELGIFKRLGRFVTRHAVPVILFWVALAAGLNFAIPQIEQVIAERSAPFVPVTADSVRATGEVAERFHEDGTQALAFVVLTNDNGLTGADRGYYDLLAGRLRADTGHVASVQDINVRPALKDAVSSKDGKSLYLPVGLHGTIGAPEVAENLRAVREAAADQEHSDDLEVHVTGPAATIADELQETESSMLAITAATVVLIALILLMIYRSLVTALIPLAVIGISLAVSRAVVAFWGEHSLPVSTFTTALTTALVLGAGTDYAVFLISRFHEHRRAGVDSGGAVAGATSKVAAVIVASGATVAAACACLFFAEIGIFRTTGPGVSVSIVITLLVALTLTPALLTVASRRGLAEPRGAARTRHWRVAGARVVRGPGRVLALSLVLLIALAAFLPGIRLSFDERGMQPDGTDSNLGYTSLAEHFPANELLPDYLLIDAGHDLRNPAGLAALENVAAAVAKVPGVSMVRGATRPLGSTIPEASVGYQSGQVGERLDSAAKQLADGQGKTDELAGGARDLAGGTRELAGGAGGLVDGTGRLAEGSKAAVDGAARLLTGLETADDGLGTAAGGARQLEDGAGQLAAGAGQLADTLNFAYQQAKTLADGIGLALDGLNASPLCGLDPFCRQVRAGLTEIYQAGRTQLMDGLKQLADGSRRLADGNTELAARIGELRSGLDAARAGMGELTSAQRTFKDKLGELSAGAEAANDGAGRLAEGAGTAADGAGQVRDGTAALAESTGQLTGGLREAADFLLEVGAGAGDPAIGGFYLPARAFGDPKFALASGYFLSADGRTARMIVLGDSDPFGAAAIERAKAVRQAAEQAVRNSPLADAGIAATGMAATNADLAELVESDFLLVALMALATIFLILVLLLRGFVAPLYLLLSVVLSYGSALGLSVAVWQHLLHQDLHWSVAPIAFIALVAVGADYNLLLITRIRDESVRGTRTGIIRAVGATGGVITSAGVIFAASMFAMLAGSVTTLAQIGFTVGAGLLLDTFLVRTLTVPAIAALLGGTGRARPSPALPGDAKAKSRLFAR